VGVSRSAKRRVDRICAFPLQLCFPAAGSRRARRLLRRHELLPFSRRTDRSLPRSFRSRRRPRPARLPGRAHQTRAAESRRAAERDRTRADKSNVKNSGARGAVGFRQPRRQNEAGTRRCRLASRIPTAVVQVVFRRRRITPSATRPAPSKARLAGSGTAVDWKVRITSPPPLRTPPRSTSLIVEKSSASFR
jgi:hypothetical protein